MSSHLSSRTVAVLASLFVFVPFSTEYGNGTAPVAVERAVQAIPAHRPTFPEPKLRTLELPLTEPFIGFKGSLNPATIADDDDSRAMTRDALATPRTDA